MLITPEYLDSRYIYDLKLYKPHISVMATRYLLFLVFLDEFYDEKINFTNFT